MSGQPGDGLDPEKKAAMEAMQARIQAAGKQLFNKLEHDEVLKRLASGLTFSYRLAYWLISEIFAHEDMTQEMAQLLIQSRDKEARDTFNFLELMQEMKQKQLPWLASRERESKARQETLRRRLRAMSATMRREDIELPWHSMTSKFGEEGFRHNDTLVVYGDEQAVGLALRRCSQLYKKNGGRGVYMSSNDKEPKGIADTVIGRLGWRDAGDILSSFKTLLKPVVSSAVSKKPLGLVVIEDLSHLCTDEEVPLPVRIHNAYMTAKQHQVDNGYAMILGVFGDAPVTSCDRVVKAVVQESKIIGGEPQIAIGNDIMPVRELELLVYDGDKE